jgi:hypothetical protein
MSTAQVIVTTAAGVAVALGAWSVIARDGHRRRRERNDLLESFRNIRQILLMEQIDFAAEMLMLAPDTLVVTEIVSAAFEMVEAKISAGVVTTTDDARKRIREAVQAGVLAKMTDDYDRAKKHGTARQDSPAVGPDGSVSSTARSHLECMPPSARFKFMLERMSARTGERRALTGE